MKKFKQKNGYLLFRNFQIEERGLRVETKEKGQYLNYVIDFEDIGTKEAIVSQKTNFTAVIAIISIGLNIIFGFFYFLGENETFINFISIVGISLAVAISLTVRSTNEKIIQGTQNISFFYSKRDKEKVDNFIQELQKSKIHFLRKKYMKIDKYTPIHQLEHQILWLRQNNYINDNELDEINKKIEIRKLVNGK